MGEPVFPRSRPHRTGQVAHIGENALSAALHCRSFRADTRTDQRHAAGRGSNSRRPLRSGGGLVAKQPVLPVFQSTTCVVRGG